MTQGQLVVDDNGIGIQGAMCPVAAQTITISNSASAVSSQLTHYVIRLVSTVNCFVQFGQNGVQASVNSHFLPAGVVEYFNRIQHSQNAGQGLQNINPYIAVIGAGSAGYLYISEME